MDKPVEILLVEDNPYDAELALRALKKYKLANHIVHVSDGEQALDFLLQKGAFAALTPNSRPRVILLDIKLPRISGIELLKIIKQHPQLNTIPVVMLTSSREQTDVVESYNLGVNSYIVKPVEFDKFVEAVKDIGLYWLILNQPPE